MGEYMQIEGLLDKVRSTGMGGISADDRQAVEKLEAKLERLKADQEHMKAVNAYYRKHKTLEGCPALTSEGIAELQASMSRDWHKNPVPYPSFYLSNNNANIHRVEQRIHDLKNRSEFAGWEFPGGRAEINEGENRLQLFFDEKPGDEQRQALKHGGFRWSPARARGSASSTATPSMRRTASTFSGQRAAGAFRAPALSSETAGNARCRR